MNKTYRHLSSAVNVHVFCTRQSHWVLGGNHPLGDLSDPLDPEWHLTCQLNAVAIVGGGVFTFDFDALNGPYVESQCLAHGEIEVIGGN